MIQERNKVIDILKGLSLISVVSAHCNSVPETAPFFSHFFSLVLQNVGTVGVVCFFILSGFLYVTHESIGTFITKKVKRILIPWVFGATVVYFYVYLRKPPISFSSWFCFCIGKGSYFYYLTSLLALYFIFYFRFMRCVPTLIICQAVSLISLIWYYRIGAGSPYLNPFNWLGYFATGILVNRFRTQIARFIIKRKRPIALSIPIYAIAVLLKSFLNDAGTYWKIQNIVTCAIGVLALLSIALIINTKDESLLCRWLCITGQESLFVYIYHMPIAGIVAKLMSYSVLVYLVILRPFIVLLFVLLGLNLLIKATNNGDCKWIRICLGITTRS